jgi:hypothetical protein
MGLKICIGCNEELEQNKDNFYQKGKNKEGFQSRCKRCFNKQTTENHKGNNYKKYLKKYYKKNKSKIDQQNLNNYNLNKKDRSKKSKEKYQKNPEYYKKLMKNYQEKVNSDPIKLEKKRERLRNWHLQNRIKNPHIHILRNQIRNIREALGTEKILSTHKELKYTPKQFKIHIESLFKDGMLWDNIGNEKNKWNIDHKIPITWFKNNTPFYLVNNLENLEPIWWEENNKKGNKYSTPISKEFFISIKLYIKEEYFKQIKIND